MRLPLVDTMLASTVSMLRAEQACERSGGKVKVSKCTTATENLLHRSREREVKFDARPKG